MTVRAYGSCAACKCLAFKVVDVDKDGEYPVIHVICVSCQKEWSLAQLKGIEWLDPEIPF